MFAPSVNHTQQLTQQMLNLLKLDLQVESYNVNWVRNTPFDVAGIQCDY